MEAPDEGAAAACCVFLLGVASFAQTPADKMDVKTVFEPEPPMLGPHFVRGETSDAVKAARHAASLAPGASVSSPDMIWHNGSILPATTTVAIFWGKKWAKSSFVSDKITGLDSWYEGFGGSGYAATCDEYTGSGQVGSQSTYQGHVIDTTSAPTSAPSTSTIKTEVCKILGKHPKLLVTHGYYAVYVDTPRGNANYCAWHSWGTCNNKNIEFAFFFDLDGDPGCDPEDTSTSHTQGLAALANVTGHELSEARTDRVAPHGLTPTALKLPTNAHGALARLCWTSITERRGRSRETGPTSITTQHNNSAYANESGEFGCIDGGAYLE